MGAAVACLAKHSAVAGAYAIQLGIAGPRVAGLGDRLRKTLIGWYDRCGFGLGYPSASSQFHPESLQQADSIGCCQFVCIPGHIGYDITGVA